MDVFVTNPTLSAGQKLGLFVSCVLFLLIFYVIYSAGAPPKR